MKTTLRFVVIPVLATALIVMLTVTITSPASAAEAGGYFGVTAGPTDADLGVSDFNDGSVTAGSVDDGDTGKKLFGGYRFTENVALEGGFVDLGEVEFTGFSNGLGFLFLAGPVAVDIEADGLFVAGVFSKNYTKGALFGKVGFLNWDADVTLVDSGGALSGDDDGTDVMFGIGGEYWFNDRAALRVEFEMFTEILDEDISLISLGVVINP